MNIILFKITMAIFMATMLAGCQSSPQREPSQGPEAAKIKFNMDNIHSDGLRGAPDGLVAVAYEFCVPTVDRVYREVQRIDPSVKFQLGSRGRIGCASDQTLSISETNQPNWREVLMELSSLSYITEIQEIFFE